MRVVIKEEEWGPGYLMDPRNGKKCCLGFACLALGKTEADILNACMPDQVGEHKFEVGPSEKLLQLACDARIHGYSVGKIAAHANDNYHNTRSANKKAKYLAVMRQAFKDVGLTFVLRRRAK